MAKKARISVKDNVITYGKKTKPVTYTAKGVGWRIYVVADFHTGNGVKVYSSYIQKLGRDIARAGSMELSISEALAKGLDKLGYGITKTAASKSS